jgi:hypothetical protein
VKAVAIYDLSYTSISFSVPPIRNGSIACGNPPDNPRFRCSSSVEVAETIFGREDIHDINQLLAIDGNGNFV